jgi:serine/threonine protein kinase
MDVKSSVSDFKNGFEPCDIPKEITTRFHITQRLGFNDFGETFLLSEKDSRDLFVLKKCRKSELLAVNEAELLHGLSHMGLPVYEKSIENENDIFIIRRYIIGMTLAHYIEDEKSVNTQLVVNAMISLCDILNYLHVQSAPIIHRDIKPSNIIINPENNTISLIDFGISRKYSVNAKGDTVFFGTQKFAPPEQYGFAQTDCRSDIFSLGVVMRYWLTGETDSNAKINDRALRYVVESCTKLDPESRPQNAFDLKITLLALLSPDTIAEKTFPFELDHDEFRMIARNGGFSEHLSRVGFARYGYIEGVGLRIHNRTHHFESVYFHISTFPPGDYVLEIEFDCEDKSAVFELAGGDKPLGVITRSNENKIQYNLKIEEVDGKNKANVIDFLNGLQSYQERLIPQTLMPPSQNHGRGAPNPDLIIKSIKVYKA